MYDFKNWHEIKEIHKTQRIFILHSQQRMKMFLPYPLNAHAFMQCQPIMTQQTSHVTPDGILLVIIVMLSILKVLARYSLAIISDFIMFSFGYRVMFSRRARISDTTEEGTSVAVFTCARLAFMSSASMNSQIREGRIGSQNNSDDHSAYRSVLTPSWKQYWQSYQFLVVQTIVVFLASVKI